MSTETQRASVAEAVLSLVTAPERAAAIAGDLAEDGRRNGRCFWVELGCVASRFHTLTARARRARMEVAEAG